MTEKSKKRIKKVVLTTIVGGAVIGVGCYYVNSRPLGPSINRPSSCTCKATGSPKIAYSTAFGAKLAAVVDSIFFATKMIAYKCPICGMYHIGHCQAS